MHSPAEYTVPGVAPAGGEYKIELVAKLIEKIREHGVLAFEESIHETASMAVLSLVAFAVMLVLVVIAVISFGAGISNSVKGTFSQIVVALGPGGGGTSDEGSGGAGGGSGSSGGSGAPGGSGTGGMR